MVKVKGPFGFVYPFAICEFSQIRDERAKQALARLRGIQ